MSVLIPVFILIATLVAQIASNRLQKDFRSYWLVSAGGTLLAGLALFFFRLRLPSSVALSGWWAGEGVEFPLNFVIGPFSWPLAFALLTLFAAGLLVELRRPGTQSWLPWAPGLALAAAGLLAVLAGDLLAFAFALFILDLLMFAVHLNISQAEEHSGIFDRFTVNLASNILLLLAWAIPASYAELGSLMILITAGTRMAIGSRVPDPDESARFDFYAIVQFGSLSAALALLCMIPPLTGPIQIVVLTALCLFAIWEGFRWATGDGSTKFRRLALVAMILAAACAGSPIGVVGFGLNLLLGHTLFTLPGQIYKVRWLLVGLAILMLSALPFTPMQFSINLYAAASPWVFIFLLPQGVLLAGTARRLFANARTAQPDAQRPQASAILAPIVYLLFGLGLTPRAPEAALPIWPAAAVIAIAAVSFFFTRSGRRLLPPHGLPSLPNFSLAAAGRALGRAGAYVLALAGGLLEGEAGVIWALLLVALLISFMTQTGFSR